MLSLEVVRSLLLRKRSCNFVCVNATLFITRGLGYNLYAEITVKK